MDRKQKETETYEKMCILCVRLLLLVGGTPFTLFYVIRPKKYKKI